MAKSKKAGTSALPAGRFRAKATRAVRRARGIFGDKVKWGEAGLSLIVGYLGDKILEPVTNPVFNATNGKNAAMTAWQNSAGQQYGNWARGVNKELGTVAVAKVAYDVIKKGRLDSNDVSIYLPFAIGTVFDAPDGAGNKTVSSREW